MFGIATDFQSFVSDRQKNPLETLISPGYGQHIMFQRGFLMFICYLPNDK